MVKKEDLELTEEVKKLREPYERIKGSQNIWKPVGKKYEDLSEQKFGRLTAVKPVGMGKYNNLLWLCECDCSNKVIVVADNLKRKTRSCGCIRKEMLSKRMSKDLTGKIFGRLTVLDKAGKDKFGKVLWEVKCSCGTIFKVSTERLTTGQTRSCDCLAKDLTKERCTKPMIGKTFGRLTVIEEAYRKKGKGVYYKCLCSCGNTVVVQGSMLRSGNTKSCGCLGKERAHERNFKDLRGQRFGKLVVVELAPKKKGHSTRYICKCDCGGIVETTRDGLVDGSTMSCGCMKSKGEWKVSEILKENKITFEKQKTYDDFRNETQGVPRFDFYVPEGDYLIEYDGEQHFMHTNLGWNDEEHFKKVQKRDKLKNEYCKANNIPLIRIPYTHYADLCIEDLKLETSKFIVN